MTKVRRADGPVVDIHCHRECAPAAELVRDAARAAGKVALGHGNATTRAVNERQLATIRPKMDRLDVRLADMDRMGVDERDLTEAFERADRAGARESARRYCQLAKQRVREILAHTGGRL